MSNIVNIALDNYTDFRKFEELATTILNDDVYMYYISMTNLHSLHSPAPQYLPKLKQRYHLIFEN